MKFPFKEARWSPEVNLQLLFSSNQRAIVIQQKKTSSYNELAGFSSSLKN